MKKITTYFALLSIVALALLAAPMLGQNQQYPFPGYPPQFSPLRTSRPHPTDPPAPQTKFVKASHDAIPNAYIVILDDRAVPQANPRDQLRSIIASIANSLAQLHSGKVGYIYESVLRASQLRCPKRLRLRLARIHK